MSLAIQRLQEGFLREQGACGRSGHISGKQILSDRFSFQCGRSSCDRKKGIFSYGFSLC